MQDDGRKYHGAGQIGHDKFGDDTFAAACRAADAKRAAERPDKHLEFLRELMSDNVSLVAVQAAMYRQHFEGRAAASTVEAVVYELRTHGLAQLKKPNCQRRLGELSPEQLREVMARLIR